MWENKLPKEAKVILLAVSVVILFWFVAFWTPPLSQQDLISKIQKVDVDCTVYNESTYVFNNHGFKSYFPTKPTTEILDVDTVKATNIFALDETKNILYAVLITEGEVSSTEYPELMLASYFDSYLATSPTIINPKIIEKTRIDYNGHSAYEYKFYYNESTTPLIQQGIYFIEGNRMFKVAITYTHLNIGEVANEYLMFTSTFGTLIEK